MVECRLDVDEVYDSLLKKHWPEQPIEGHVVSASHSVT